MTVHFVMVGAFGAVALLVAAVRFAFVFVSRVGAVDHHYWILAACAYRAQRGFPVRIEGKYLLEDERQTYPPGFGLFLALFPETFLRVLPACGSSSLWTLRRSRCSLIAASVLGVGAWGLVALVAVYGLAPVLVAYNTQLTSRGLGNLFLVVKLLAEAAAVASDGVSALAFWLVAVVATALVILTHKMTTQFMLALWPIWALALGSAVAATVPLLGLVSRITGDRSCLPTPAMVGACRDRRLLESQLALPRRPSVSSVADVRRRIAACARCVPSAWVRWNPAPPRSGGRLPSGRLGLAVDAPRRGRSARLGSWPGSLLPWRSHSRHCSCRASNALAVVSSICSTPCRRRRCGGRFSYRNPDHAGPDALRDRHDRDRRKPRARMAQANAPVEKQSDPFNSVVERLGVCRDARRAYPVTAAERIAVETPTLYSGEGTVSASARSNRTGPWFANRSAQRSGVTVSHMPLSIRVGGPRARRSSRANLFAQHPRLFGTWRLFAVSHPARRAHDRPRASLASPALIGTRCRPRASQA